VNACRYTVLDEVIIAAWSSSRLRRLKQGWRHSSQSCLLRILTLSIVTTRTVTTRIPEDDEEPLTPDGGSSRRPLAAVEQ